VSCVTTVTFVLVTPPTSRRTSSLCPAQRIIRVVDRHLESPVDRRMVRCQDKNSSARITRASQGQAQPSRRPASPVSSRPSAAAATLPAPGLAHCARYRCATRLCARTARTAAANPPGQAVGRVGHFQSRIVAGVTANLTGSGVLLDRVIQKVCDDQNATTSGLSATSRSLRWPRRVAGRVGQWLPISSRVAGARPARAPPIVDRVVPGEREQAGEPSSPCVARFAAHRDTMASSGHSHRLRQRAQLRDRRAQFVGDVGSDASLALERASRRANRSFSRSTNGRSSAGSLPALKRVCSVDAEIC